MCAEVTREPTEDNNLLYISPQQKAKKRLKDAHVLSRQKQLSVEAERISNILENCISHIEIAVTLEALLEKDNMPVFMDKEMSRTLQEHQVVCERLKTLDSVKLTSHGEQDGEGGEVGERKMAQLERAVKNSFRNLLRFVRGKPEAISSLKAELGMGARESENSLIGGLKKFHKKNMKKLLTTPEKEQQTLYSQPTSSYVLEKVEIESVEEAITEIATAIKETDAQISELENEIQTLERSLNDKYFPEVDVALLADKQCKPYIKTAKKKQDSKQQEINQFNIQLNNLFLKNRKTERVNQEKTEMVKMEIEDFLRKFDEEIEEIQGNLERSQIELEGDQEELRNLEKFYNVLELEYSQVQERRQLAEEKRREEMIELDLKTKAAILAQSWWRGYSVRKAMKNKGKNKKAKKGKGKRTKY
ncbi:dynein regulatory complex protein 10 [Sphaeramia orbicularis]|uniref:Dynein regulatory complex protein 10 n=1 Tax=Sphaeramia orbicularis TaxID=375764 RepID=A0A673D017_9TELE|nr:dynein regulatory complex protein 10-like [Sphaeramia orbicularis]XP_029999842.1 dynein regulatory complex protein 10-like [Sphaeramia orbicularis]XP_029999843.1 dynein regulatory complex protein 10-like [Sphaeramia orbicularis]